MSTDNKFLLSILCTHTHTHSRARVCICTHYMYTDRHCPFIQLAMQLLHSRLRERKRKEEVVLINGCLRRRTQQQDKLNAGNSRQVSCSSRRLGFAPGAMNLFVRQTERADSRLDGLASRLFTIRRKNISECGSPLFASYLCHRGMAARSLVIRFYDSAQLFRNFW